MNKLELNKYFLVAIIFIGIFLLLREGLFWHSYCHLKNSVQSMMSRNKDLIMNDLDNFDKVHERMANRFKARSREFDKKFESYKQKENQKDRQNLKCDKEQELKIHESLVQILKDAESDLNIEELKNLQTRLRAFYAELNDYKRNHPEC